MSSHQEFTEVEAAIIILHSAFKTDNKILRKQTKKKRKKMESAVKIIFSARTSSKAEKIMLATLVPWSGIFGSKLVIIVST